jgi:YggT family protein
VLTASYCNMGACCAPQLTDPFLNVFRGIVPPLGGVDLSPMLGFFLLNFLKGVLLGMA